MVNREQMSERHTNCDSKDYRLFRVKSHVSHVSGIGVDAFVELCSAHGSTLVRIVALSLILRTGIWMRKLASGMRQLAGTRASYRRAHAAPLAGLISDRVVYSDGRKTGTSGE